MVGALVKNYSQEALPMKARTLSGLLVATNYSIRVAAVNRAGTGGFSDAVIHHTNLS